jgi:hypothetical protein
MEIKGNLDMQRQRACLAKIQELVEKMYGDINPLVAENFFFEF